MILSFVTFFFSSFSELCLFSIVPWHLFFYVWSVRSCFNRMLLFRYPFEFILSRELHLCHLTLILPFILPLFQTSFFLKNISSMSSQEYLSQDFSWPSSPVDFDGVTSCGQIPECVSLDEIPDSDPEIDIETPVTDSSLLLSTNLSQTKGWVLGRAGFHGKINVKHLQALQGVVVLPIREFTLLRDSRDFKHLVFLPLSSQDLQAHPDLANLTQFLQ